MGQAKIRKEKGEYPERTKRIRVHPRKIKHSVPRNLSIIGEDIKGTKYHTNEKGTTRRVNDGTNVR